MSEVVVFGSVNIDRTIRVNMADVASLADRYDWFPVAGETVAIESVPNEALEAGAAPVSRVGGKGANQATAAVRAGGKASFLGAVGRDAVDTTRIDPRDRLAADGVDVSGIETRGPTTGAAYIWVRPDGENHIVIVAGANARLDAEFARQHAAKARAAQVVLLQNEVPASAMRALLDELPARRAGGPTVVFDPSPTDDAQSVLGHGRVDIAVPNETESAKLAAVLAGFDGTVIRTLGAEGVEVESPNQPTWSLEAPAVDVVDATGAGDAFVGYLAARLARGTSLRGAVEAATVAGALSTTQEGARTPPEAAEVRAFDR